MPAHSGVLVRGVLRASTPSGPRVFTDDDDPSGGDDETSMNPAKRRWCAALVATCVVGGLAATVDLAGAPVLRRNDGTWDARVEDVDGDSKGDLLASLVVDSTHGAVPQLVAPSTV
jgi:hypothetical protein